MLLAGCGAFTVDLGETGTPDTSSSGTGETGGSDDTDDSSDSDDTAVDDDPLCDAELDVSPPGGPDCVTAALQCGETIEATTEGGLSTFATADYAHLFCFVASEGAEFTASERVYAIDLGAGTNAALTLDAPCAEMGLAVMRWTDADTCPTSEDPVTSCEGDSGSGKVEISFGGYPSANTWVAVVDTAAAASAAFRLTLACE